MAAPVDVSGEFPTLFNFEKSKRRPDLLIAFSKIVDYKGSLEQIKKKSKFWFCPTIRLNYRQSVLKL